MFRFKFLIPQLSDSKKRKVEIIKRGSKLQVMASFVVSYSTPSTPKKKVRKGLIFGWFQNIFPQKSFKISQF